VTPPRELFIRALHRPVDSTRQWLRVSYQVIHLLNSEPTIVQLFEMFSDRLFWVYQVVLFHRARPHNNFMRTAWPMFDNLLAQMWLAAPSSILLCDLVSVQTSDCCYMAIHLETVISNTILNETQTCCEIHLFSSSFTQPLFMYVQCLQGDSLSSLTPYTFFIYRPGVLIFHRM